MFLLCFRYEFPTSVWSYRIFAWVWLVCLLYTAPYVLTVAAISWYTSRYGWPLLKWFRPKTKLPQITYTLPENERKTILITGCTTTKGKLLFFKYYINLYINLPIPMSGYDRYNIGIIIDRYIGLADMENP